MPTLLEIKNRVAEQLGATDGATPDQVRDRAINRARNQFYSARNWTFLRKSDTLAPVSRRAAFPAELNPQASIRVWEGSTQGSGIDYLQVSIADILTTLEPYAFALDYESSEIVLNTDASPNIAYYILPADKALDGTEDGDVEPTIHIEPIVLLAIANWWLASERSRTNYQLFKDEYAQALSQVSMMDANSEGVLMFPSDAMDNGYNSGHGVRSQYGYRNWR